MKAYSPNLDPREALGKSLPSQSLCLARPERETQPWPSSLACFQSVQNPWVHSGPSAPPIGSLQSLSDALQPNFKPKASNRHFRIGTSETAKPIITPGSKAPELSSTWELSLPLCRPLSLIGLKPKPQKPDHLKEADSKSHTPVNRVFPKPQPIQTDQRGPDLTVQSLGRGPKSPWLVGVRSTGAVNKKRVSTQNPQGLGKAHSNRPPSESIRPQ